MSATYSLRASAPRSSAVSKPWPSCTSRATRRRPKLVYLLGLDPLTQLVPMDEAPVPIDAVDATPEPAVLVERALSGGPGVRELQMLLAVLQDGMTKLEGPQRYIPKIGLTANEGAWGAGPGSSLTWDNRFDVGVSARWNLTEFLTSREQRRIADSRMQQAQLSYQDLRGKLALSVEEARTAILSGQEQIKTGQEQIQHASRTLELTNTRLVETVPGSSTTEVLQSMRTGDRQNSTSCRRSRLTPGAKTEFG